MSLRSVPFQDLETNTTPPLLAVPDLGHRISRQRRKVDMRQLQFNPATIFYRVAEQSLSACSP